MENRFYGTHCLHYLEGNGDCCDCGQGFAHCDECGWGGEIVEGPAVSSEGTIDPNLCPECGNFICQSFEDCPIFK